MRRREFITLLGGVAVAWPLDARAQQPERVRRIGVLMGFAESDPEAQAWVKMFRDGLQKLGWTEGRNTKIDTRWTTPDDAEAMQRFAKELVALQPDLKYHLRCSPAPTRSSSKVLLHLLTTGYGTECGCWHVRFDGKSWGVTGPSRGCVK
jgi:hypothetical protein